MSLPPLRGHTEARRVLARAIQRGELAQSLLVHGPGGIGKERFALWVGQRLLCEDPHGEVEPCGRCVACRRAERLAHPDLHWFFPLPRPEGAHSPARLREKLEDLRAAELQSRRTNPGYVPAPGKAPAHFLAAVQTMQEIASRRPSAGRHKVFVVGDAEAMVPQESSPEAANAFLKLLEEPPSDTTLLLTTAAPDALLPTIRSRILPLRLLPLPAEEVEAFLANDARAAPEAARATAQRAGGSIGRALRLLHAAGEGDESSQDHAMELVRAVLADSATERFALAVREKSTGGRGHFLETLDAFAGRMRDLAAIAAGAPERTENPQVRKTLEAELRRRPVAGSAAAAALARVLKARELALGNVNPQLILTDLLRGVQAELRGSSWP